MSLESIPDAVQCRYNGAWVRGPRITRLEENSLGYFRLDSGTAWNLGKNNVGVFVGACQPLGETIECLKRLEQPTVSQHWIVVAATKKMAAVIVQRWFRSGQARRVAITTLKLPMVLHNIVLATPESLRRIGDAERCDVAGIVVVDMLCHIHQARGGIQHGNFYVSNDRPQLIANFRNTVALDGWLPPLVFVTQKAAKSVSTDSIARAYCLDAWWFVDGRSLRCGAPPPCQGDHAAGKHGAEGVEEIVPKAHERHDQAAQSE